jgi:hypothetical protein
MTVSGELNWMKSAGTLKILIAKVIVLNLKKFEKD